MMPFRILVSQGRPRTRLVSFLLKKKRGPHPVVVGILPGRSQPSLLAGLTIVSATETLIEQIVSCPQNNLESTTCTRGVSIKNP